MQSELLPDDLLSAIKQRIVSADRDECAPSPFVPSALGHPESEQPEQVVAQPDSRRKGRASTGVAHPHMHSFAQAGVEAAQDRYRHATRFPHADQLGPGTVSPVWAVVAALRDEQAEEVVEIGRASCRERVESWGGGITLKERGCSK